VAKPNPYDIILAGKGYMLARSEQLGRGGRAWQVTSQGASIARQTERESRYGNQPPNIELPVVWSTAHLGYGDERQVQEGRYHYAVGVDARFPEMLIPGPYVTVVSTGLSENVTRFAEIGGKLLFLAGRYVKEFASNDGINAERDLTAGKAGVDMEVFNDCLYVGMAFGAGDFIHKRTAAGAWSQDNDVQAGYMTVAKDRLCAQVSVRKVSWVQGDDDPMDLTKWGGSYTVGESTSAITTLGALEDLLYIGKQDGLYAMDEDGIAPALTPELRAYRHADNCRNLRPWHGTVWVPHLRGLLEYRSMGEQGNVVRSAQPARDCLSENPVRGRITALAGDDRWLYAALYNGTDTYLLAGRETTEQEAPLGRLIWHPLAKVAGKRCDAMHISGLWTNPTNPRLFLGAGADVAYIILPRDTDNPLADANCLFATSGHLCYSSNDSGVPATTKLYKSIEIDVEDADAYDYVEAFYRVDASGWTNAGRAATPGVTTFELDPYGIAGKTLEVRLNLVLASNTGRVKVRPVVARAAERPKTVDVITAVIRCSDGLRRNDGSPERRTGAEMLAELWALPSLGQSVPLVDVVGGKRQVLVQAPIDEREIEAESKKNPEVLATVAMTVFSTQPTASAWTVVQFALGGVSQTLQVPVEVPVFVGSTTLDHYQVVSYPGTAPTYPVLKFTGPVTDLVITSLRTGEVLDFTGSSIASGDYRLIDLHRATKVIVDSTGGDRSGELVAGSDLETFHLDPGDNEFHLQGSGIDEESAGELRYILKEA